jgi:hypothetical protein
VTVPDQADFRYAYAVEVESAQARLHAVSVGPPLDQMTVCGWRYRVRGLRIEADWMATNSRDRCAECAAILGEESTNVEWHKVHY